MDGKRIGLVLILAGCVSWGAGCRPKDKEPAEVLVRVEAVAFDRVAQSSVVVLQEENGQRRLPIWIGPSEAQAIALHLEKVTPPRPLTHDLMKAVLEGTGAVLEKVVVTELREGIYYARMFIRSRGEILQLDSRPSDAIALAVRVKSPIYVVPTVFDASQGSPVREAPEQDLRVHFRRERLDQRRGNGVGLAGIPNSRGSRGVCELDGNGRV